MGEAFGGRNLLGQKADNIEGFLADQVIERGLDERTGKAYRLDLEHLYRWFEKSGGDALDGEAVNAYLRYLSDERRLKPSTVMRKYRVFRSYLEYLFAGEDAQEAGALIPPPVLVEEEKQDHRLSKAEIDAFLVALSREYDNLETDFRKRICLRDSVMMELLFYHGIEISELLRLNLSDYNRKTGVLSIRRKRKGERNVRLFSPNLRSKLEGWLDSHAYFETDDQYQDCLFLSKCGRPLSMKMVIYIFDKYRLMAGIEKESTPKDLKCSMKRYAQELMMERCS